VPRRRQTTDVIVEILIAVTLGLVIGVACRWFDLPLPAPPKIVGALLVISMTLGFMLVDHALGGLQ